MKAPKLADFPITRVFKATIFYHCRGREDAVDVCDMIAAKANRLSDTKAHKGLDVKCWIGGPCHIPYIEIEASTKLKARRFIKSVMAYGLRFKGVLFEA